MSLKINNIVKKFGDFTALNNISLEINEGEFLAILGPSGCGKTTLLRIIGGFEVPTSGEIINNGEVMSSANVNVPVEKRNLGMVFQSFALWPHMTVREHVEFPLKSKRCKMSDSEKKEAVDSALEAMRLTSMEGRYPGELSGGQKQRVALARAIVEKPAILLMDEPLSALDAELKISMRKEIQDIHRLTKATIIYITHDQSEALALADRILIMKDGKIEQLGTPKEIYEHPQTQFAATFVSKCNLIKGTWKNNEFTTLDNNFTTKNTGIAKEFVEKGLYPIRPDEFIINKAGKGIMGVIVNKQYNGRENHYTIQSHDDLYTVYTDEKTHFENGENIFLTKKEIQLEATY